MTTNNTNCLIPDFPGMDKLNSLRSVERQRIVPKQAVEEILKDNPSRWVILPLRYPAAWDFFKLHEHDFWTSETQQYTFECIEFDRETAIALQKFFRIDAASDKLVFGNINHHTCILLEEVQIPEARAFFGFEIAYNTIISETLCTFLLNIQNGPDPNKTPTQEDCQNPSVLCKAAWWNEKNCNSYGQAKGTSFAERLLKHAIGKSIFTSCRCLLANALASSKYKESTTYPAVVERIVRTNKLHASFAFFCYSMISSDCRLSNELVQMYVDSAVHLEIEFCKNFLPMEALNISTESVETFVRQVGSSVLKCFLSDDGVGQNQKTETLDTAIVLDSLTPSVLSANTMLKEKVTTHTTAASSVNASRTASTS